MVPIAIPGFCLSVFFENINILFYNTTSAKSMMVSVATYFSFWILTCFLKAERPSSCRPLTSIVPKKQTSGNFSREGSFFRKPFVSLI